MDLVGFLTGDFFLGRSVGCGRCIDMCINLNDLIFGKNSMFEGKIFVLRLKKVQNNIIY